MSPDDIPPRRTEPPLHRVIAEGLRQSAELGRLELALFKAEMTENVQRLFVGLGMMVAGAVFAIVAISVLIEALIAWLAVVLDSRALAALICGIVAAVIALIFVLIGRSMMRLENLTPQRTAASVKQDAQLLAEKVQG